MSFYKLLTRTQANDLYFCPHSFKRNLYSYYYYSGTFIRFVPNFSAENNLVRDTSVKVMKPLVAI